MITRRALLANATLATTALVVTATLPGCDPTPAPAAEATSAPLPKLYGMTDCGLRHRVSAKFTGPGFYAFGREGGESFRVFYCEPDRGGFLPGFIDLSQGAGDPLQMSLSPRCFDETCFGVCMTPAEAERRALS